MVEVVVAHYRFSSPIEGQTTHITSNRVQDGFDELKIVKHGPEEFNLLYFRDGANITDTGHGSVDEALAQASFEFGISRKDWQFAC